MRGGGGRLGLYDQALELVTIDRLRGGHHRLVLQFSLSRNVLVKFSAYYALQPLLITLLVTPDLDFSIR